MDTPERLADRIQALEANMFAERARIRRGLLEWADANRFILYSDRNGQWLSLDDFRAALDRICPEGKE